MSKIKVAVIGCGNIAHAAHIPAYLKLENVEIKYFCDINEETAKKTVEEYSCGQAITDYHTILADDEVTAVSVCTPNLMHSIISIDCLRAGKHVLCEKPSARIYSEALEMQKAQHETGKILSIGVVNRFHGAVNAAKAHIDAGDLGEVYHVISNFRAYRSIPGIGGAFTTKAISGGGALIDWGVHRIDLIMYCIGDPKPLTVSGKAFCKLGVDIPNYVYKNMWSVNTRDVNGTYDVDDSVSAFIRTAGPTISLNGAWAQNIGRDDDFVDFLGTKAGIRLAYCSDYELFGVKDGELTYEKPDYDRTNMFDREIASFINSTITGEKTAAHIDNAILTSRIMQGIYDSSDTGREVVFG